MAKPKRAKGPNVAENYRHPESESPLRPDVGTQAQFKKHKPPVTYSYDSSLDPQLVWSGKAERLSFDVPTLPLFVHERLSTKAILETLKGHKLVHYEGLDGQVQMIYMDQPFVRRRDVKHDDDEGLTRELVHSNR